MAIERRRPGRAAAEPESRLPRIILAMTCALALAAIVVWSSARPIGLGTSGRGGAVTSRNTVSENGPTLVIPPGRPRVPILEYHYIRVNPNPSDRLGFNLSVTPDDFAAQMDWLAAHGYHPITLADLRAYFEQGRTLPARPVVLSFDDGYLDFYETAFPILQAHHFKSVAYIVPGFLNRPAYMSGDQVAGLDRTGLVEIGSHTMHHVNLASADPAGLAAEVNQSKSVLEALLHHPVLDFCYPAGAFNSDVEDALTAVGYQSATTELPGIEHSWSDRLTWTRVRVGGGENLSDFTAGLGDAEPAVPSPTRSPQS
jgi:peptidoglycan/xylan/chitin deacetylase (PgdA/CDA1 family)